MKAFDAIEISAASYLRLSDCMQGKTALLNACWRAGFAPMLIRDVRAGRAARDGLWAASRGSSGGADITNAYQAMIAATAAIRQDLSK